MDLTNTIITVLAFVLIFIFAIQKFSAHIEEIAGSRLKEILNGWTNTPIKGTITGAIFAAIIQSGTAATIITVGLVNSGIISFMNALGIVIGINLGTTVTSELIALNMTYIAPVVVIIGFILSHTHSRLRKYGRAVFYFGVMFLSLLIISFLIAPLKSDPFVVSILKNSNGLYATVIIGAIATATLQSGSVLMGLVMIMASGGLLGITQALGFMFGTSIGGPTASLVASMHAKPEAKKVAVAQMIFNLLGILIFLPLAMPFEKLLGVITPNISQQIVNAQFIFNIATAALCLVFIKSFASLTSSVTKRLL